MSSIGPKLKRPRNTLGNSNPVAPKAGKKVEDQSSERLGIRFDTEISTIKGNKRILFAEKIVMQNKEKLKEIPNLPTKINPIIHQLDKTSKNLFERYTIKGKLIQYLSTLTGQINTFQTTMNNELSPIFIKIQQIIEKAKRLKDEQLAKIKKAAEDKELKNQAKSRDGIRASLIKICSPIKYKSQISNPSLIEYIILENDADIIWNHDKNIIYQKNEGEDTAAVKNIKRLTDNNVIPVDGKRITTLKNVVVCPNTKKTKNRLNLLKFISDPPLVSVPIPLPTDLNKVEIPPELNDFFEAKEIYDKIASGVVITQDEQTFLYITFLHFDDCITNPSTCPSIAQIKYLLDQVEIEIVSYLDDLMRLLSTPYDSTAIITAFKNTHSSIVASIDSGAATGVVFNGVPDFGSIPGAKEYQAVVVPVITTADMAHDDPADAQQSMDDTLAQFKKNNAYWLDKEEYASVKALYTAAESIAEANIGDKLKQDTCRQVVKDIGAILIKKLKELPGEAAKRITQNIRSDPVHFILNVTDPESIKNALSELHKTGITKMYGEAMHAVGLNILLKALKDAGFEQIIIPSIADLDPATNLLSKDKWQSAEGTAALTIEKLLASDDGADPSSPNTYGPLQFPPIFPAAAAAAGGGKTKHKSSTSSKSSASSKSSVSVFSRKSTGDKSVVSLFEQRQGSKKGQKTQRSHRAPSTLSTISELPRRSTAVPLVLPPSVPIQVAPAIVEQAIAPTVAAPTVAANIVIEPAAVPVVASVIIEPVVGVENAHEMLFRTKLPKYYYVNGAKMSVIKPGTLGESLFPATLNEADPHNRPCPTSPTGVFYEHVQKINGIKYRIRSRIIETGGSLDFDVVLIFRSDSAGKLNPLPVNLMSELKRGESARGTGVSRAQFVAYRPNGSKIERDGLVNILQGGEGPEMKEMFNELISLDKADGDARQGAGCDSKTLVISLDLIFILIRVYIYGKPGAWFYNGQLIIFYPFPLIESPEQVKTKKIEIAYLNLPSTRTTIIKNYIAMQEIYTKIATSFTSNPIVQTAAEAAYSTLNPALAQDANAAVRDLLSRLTEKSYPAGGMNVAIEQITHIQAANSRFMDVRQYLETTAKLILNIGAIRTTEKQIETKKLILSMYDYISECSYSQDKSVIVQRMISILLEAAADTDKSRLDILTHVSGILDNLLRQNAAGKWEIITTTDTPKLPLADPIDTGKLIDIKEYVLTEIEAIQRNAAADVAAEVVAEVATGVAEEEEAVEGYPIDEYGFQPPFSQLPAAPNTQPNAGMSQGLWMYNEQGGGRRTRKLKKHTKSKHGTTLGRLLSRKHRRLHLRGSDRRQGSPAPTAQRHTQRRRPSHRRKTRRLA